jgi:hypothetical protein
MHTKIWEAVKDPDERKDYMVVWADLLAGDTISDSEWTVPASSELIIESESFTDDTTTIWLSGGKIGTHALLNRVTTTGSRIYDQTVKLYVQSK